MESWPYDTPEPRLEAADRDRNLAQARRLMERLELDALVVTSSDRWLNEYTPAADNHRFLLSGFTGSTAFLLLSRARRARLYVDGRYHQQADAETDPAAVEVVKVGLGEQLAQTLLDDLGEAGRVGFEADRISCAFAAAIGRAASATLALERGELETALGGDRPRPGRPIEALDVAYAGRTSAAKLRAVREEADAAPDTAILVAALDDLAWLAHARGWHFLHQASFAGVGLAGPDGLDVAVDPAVFEAGVPETDAEGAVRWHGAPLETVLATPRFDGIRQVLLDPARTTAAVRAEVRRARPDWRIVERPGPVVAVKARKTPAELAELEAANRRAGQAITRAAGWLRERLAAGAATSELAFHDAANRAYADEGARDLSFRTIAAFGPSSAIIHFGDPSAERLAGRDDLVLLDSGAIFAGGLATDVTRTFLAGGTLASPSERQRRLHTLVLKGLIQGHLARIPAGARGAYLDARVRAPLHDAGFDFAHGTGHGVGVHVHEAGIGISPGSTTPIRAGHVCSIEPGIYVPGYGGVRLENVVVFEPCAEAPGFLAVRPLTFVGFDAALIDRELLEPREAAWLDAYHARCAELGALI